MHLNHPETIPPTLVPGKTVFHETHPWSRKGRGLLAYSIQALEGTEQQQGPAGALASRAGQRALARESLWAHSPAQRGPAQHPSPSLGWLLNEPSCSLMHPLSVRLSGEDMERENALGYQYNLSWGHQISTCCLCPVLHLCPEGCPSATTYTGRVPTGERVMDLLLRLPRPWTLPQLRGPRAFPWILREISTSFWERDLRRVSIFFSIHPGLTSMEAQDYITN